MEQEYYHSKESVNEYIHLAKDVNGQDLIDDFKEYLSDGASVLELGSGPGSDWRILSQDFRVTGSDYSDEFIKYLKTNNPEGEFVKLDASNLNLKQKFDAIYSNKVFQHLSDEQIKSSVKSQAKSLHKNGKICHSFWKGEGSEVFKGMLVNYMTASDIKHFFEPYFKILKIKEYAEFEEGDSLYVIGELI